ncbi:MAG TPA: heparin lyase I family protein, partial [Roseimicrobium sp.]|nr:heparin lyase I family protein [Roseimicrobium sp.]
PSLSPPVLLGLGEIDGKTAVVLNYGPTTAKAKQQIVGPMFIEKGKWHSISFVIHWSNTSEGSVSVYLDDTTKPVMTADGPNMNNEYQHYLKLGMYRHPEIATDNWIFIEGLEISKVAPR